MSSSSGHVHHRSPPDAKIALFRSLFRGRDDVYPRRFESRTTGKSGYSPACGNEWVRGICEKPRVKCATCQHRQFLPMANDDIRWHLSGLRREPDLALRSTIASGERSDVSRPIRSASGPR